MPKLDLVKSGKYTEPQLVGISWAVGIGASAILSTFIIIWAKKKLDKKYVMGPDGRHVLSPEYLAVVEAERLEKVKKIEAKQLEAMNAKSRYELGRDSPQEAIVVPESDIDVTAKISKPASSDRDSSDHGMKFKKSFKDILAKKAAFHGVNVDVVTIEGDAKLGMPLGQAAAGAQQLY
eukprot:tig00021374_g21101.t1